MPAIDAEQHLKFLLSCIKHASAGKVNFDAVAQELGIVSKAAAAKRYERLLKAHDINPANIPKGGEASKTPKRKRKEKEDIPVKSETDESEELPMIAKKEKKTAARKGGKKGEEFDGDEKNDEGVKRLFEIPEFPRHRLDSKTEEGGEGGEEEEVVYLGESATGGRAQGGEGVKVVKVEEGVEGSGGGGWNYANQGFLFSQPSSASPPVMMGREGMVMMTGRSDPDLSLGRLPSLQSMGYFSGGSHVQEPRGGGYHGGVGSSSSSASASASAASGDVDLERIYQQQFGEQRGYEGWGN
ncbi:hypothetical protein QBC41DRAFT_222705 [Cercophora samala]|uniref:Myb-like DNA-binding domain-containing protein n=1 Tax=Cercophora samala TaxID=330535 RepID=A0AA39ZFI9_9PEZI|nr:hypothetical protein QBC41DRAFT_222705 [Cercophora samala]